MIYSMTGYGRANGGGITVEIRAVNHRYLDISVRVPRAYLFLEDTIKSTLSGKFHRGKIEVALSFDKETSDVLDVSADETVAAAYVKAAEQLAGRFGMRNDLNVSTLLRLPEVMFFRKAEQDEEKLRSQVSELALKACAAFTDMRRAEGLRLREDIMAKTAVIEELIGKIEERSPVCVIEYRARLLKKLNEVLENTAIDENRILTEAVLYADKISVDEEAVRLRSHIAALKEMLGKGGTIGRKLDFLIQEFGREANTIASKNNDIELCGYAVELKSEIEKIREQVQNIE